jgi:hypothetical protein
VIMASTNMLAIRAYSTAAVPLSSFKNARIIIPSLLQILQLFIGTQKRSKIPFLHVPLELLSSCRAWTRPGL